ncbi:MAG: hypothetical protein K8I30_08920 [Anaerolineae bacterium]|nr:hypothetical protein [Anaerolineae bacterium]
MSARNRFLRYMFLTVLLLLTVGFIGYSTTFVVDQSATGFPIYWTQNIAYIQVGQEFTPTLEGVNFIELYMQDAECMTSPPPHGDSPMQVQLLIHFRTINGPVIGRSVIASLAPCFDDIARFQFPYIVRLIPRWRYVIELVYKGGRQALATGSTTDVYPGGTHISNGERILSSDLWFGEGLNLPVATSREQCKHWGWTRVMRTDGHLFFSQGQCIRYVNSPH